MTCFFQQQNRTANLIPFLNKNLRVDLPLEQNVPVVAMYYILTLLIFSCLVHCFLKRILSSFSYYFLKNPTFYVTVFDENHFYTNELIHKSSLIVLSCS